MTQFDTYYGLLGALHSYLRPATYVEIGVHKGHSLAFVQPGTTVVGVDPDPIIEVELPALAKVSEIHLFRRPKISLIWMACTRLRCPLSACSTPPIRPMTRPFSLTSKPRG